MSLRSGSTHDTCLSLVLLNLLVLFASRMTQQPKLGLVDRVFPMCSSEREFGELGEEGSAPYQSKRDEATRGGQPEGVGGGRYSPDDWKIYTLIERKTPKTDIYF